MLNDGMVKRFTIHRVALVLEQIFPNIAEYGIKMIEPSHQAILTPHTATIYGDSWGEMLDLIIRALGFLRPRIEIDF